MARVIDPVTNFAEVTLIGTYSAIDTTINLTSGTGGTLPDTTDGAFNLVWYNATDYTGPASDPQKEIVRVVTRTVDVLTVVRAQEATTATAKSIAGKTYKLVLAMTKRIVDQIDTQAQASKVLTDAIGVAGFPTQTGNAGKFLTTDGTALSFGTAGGGTFANVGTGTGTVYRNTVAGVNNLKTIKAGTNITVTNGVDDITVASTAAGGGVTIVKALGTTDFSGSQSGTIIAGYVLDGITLSANDQVLLTNQIGFPSPNGVWTIASNGLSSSRLTNLTTGETFFVESGTANAGKYYIATGIFSLAEVSPSTGGSSYAATQENVTAFTGTSITIATTITSTLLLFKNGSLITVAGGDYTISGQVITLTTASLITDKYVALIGVAIGGGSGDVTQAGTNTFTGSNDFSGATVTGIAGVNRNVKAVDTAGGNTVGFFSSGSTVDGVVVSTGDYILLTNQTPSTDNGLYLVAGPGVPTLQTTRAGDTFFATSGTANGGKTYTKSSTVGSFPNSAVNAVQAAAVGGGTSGDGKSWRIQMLNISGSYNDITYGNGTYVVVGGGPTNNAQYSTDGLIWTTSTLPATGTYVTVSYGAGLFVTMDNSGTTHSTSPDGITWTSRGTGIGGTIDLFYANGLFIALNSGSSSQLFTSTDGITFTSRTLPTSANWTSTAYGNGVFVITTYNGSNSTIAATSPDGITWTQRTLPPLGDWGMVAFGLNKFVAMRSTGSSFGITSPDGIAWTQIPINGSELCTSIAFGNGTFIVSTNNGWVLFSTDTVTWHRATLSIGIQGWAGSVYGGGKFAITNFSNNCVAIS